MIECGTATLIHKRRRDGLLIVSKMMCHRKDCVRCQSFKADKYLNILRNQNALYYKAVPTRESGTLLRRIRYRNGEYWRCPMIGGATAIVSTIPLSHKWIPFPISDLADSRLIFIGWLMRQNGNVSCTRQYRPDRKKEEYDSYAVSEDDPVDKIRKEYSSSDGKVFKPNRDDSWESLLKEMKMYCVNSLVEI